MRQLRIPLQRDDRPRGNGSALADWGHAVRHSGQPCLLLGVDGALIAVSASARELLGEQARPGLPETTWWREDFPHSTAPARERSLLARAAASGTPAHSVVQLLVDGSGAMVQVLVAPLECVGSTVALLVFLQAMAGARRSQ